VARLLLPLLTLLAFAAAAEAQPTSYRASYGPMTVCIAGYAMEVPANEAVTAMFDQSGAMVRLAMSSDRFETLNATIEGVESDGRRFTHETIALGPLGDILKYDYPTQGYYRAGIPGDAVWTEERRHREYVLPARAGASALRVTSDRFETRDDDRLLLSRFRPRDAATACQDIPPDPDNQRTIEATSWSPARIEGPAYLCLGELGMELHGGEFAQFRWPQGGYGPLGWRVRGDHYGITVGGFREFRQGHPRPYGRLLDMGYRVERNNGGSITLIAPDSYPRDPSEMGLVFLTIWGLDDAALQTMLRRLEYVRRGTRPCAPLAGAAAARGRH
jgi:hypothetical protein